MSVALAAATEHDSAGCRRIAAGLGYTTRWERPRWERQGRAGNDRDALGTTGKGGAVPPEIVSYQVDEKTTALFEIEPVAGFEPAGVGDVAGRVRDAAAPAIEAAREVLGQVRALAPDQVEVKFGLKVTGTANWLVAKAATEGNFEVTLSWAPGPTRPAGH
jgi:hypothetical protein